MLRKIYLLFLTVLATIPALAQPGTGSIKGRLTDKETGEGIPFAQVVAKLNGVLVTGNQTDLDGNYTIKPLQPGKYDIEVNAVGYSPSGAKGVTVRSDEKTDLNFSISNKQLNEVVIYADPLIHTDGQSKTTIDRTVIQKMPQRSVEAIAQTVGGVSNTGGGMSIRGSRPGGSIIYVDGVKVRGSSAVPKAALQEVTVIPGGVPANYGDVTSGIISITTRGPAAVYSGSIEAVTSGFKSGDKAVGLDPYGYNLFEGYINGPIWATVDADGLKKPILGFSASLNYSSSVEGAVSPVGYNRITPAAKEALMNDLMYTVGADAVRYSGENLRSGAFEHHKTSINSGNRSLAGTFKLDVATTKTINLTFGGRFNYGTGRIFSFANQFMNSENNGSNWGLDWSTYGKFTQRFQSDPNSASTVKNIYYMFQVDYSKNIGESKSADHGTNFFDYGYIGKYKLYKDTNQYIYNQGLNVFEQRDLPGDTLIEFTPGDKNPILARYVTEFFNMYDNKEGNYERIGEINARGGLRNGDAPNSIYGLMAAPGTPYGGYGKFNNSQFRVTASGSADVGNHALQAGFEYEQRVDRSYNLGGLVADENNRNNNLWAVARKLVNSHLQNLDTLTNLVYNFDANGNPFEDGITRIGHPIKVGDAQSEFDRNLRLKLGLDPRGTDIINIDELDPSLLSINYFNADEMINGGNNALVGYVGYDHHGNKLKRKPAFEDYFTAKDEYGNFTNQIGAFSPIYFAGYIMDKFDFKDINFNVGLRIDRYDGNQKVLKDKFLFKEAYTVDEISGKPYDKGVRPGSIGNDYVVYVDDVNNPKNIIGYRSGSQFYNAKGDVANAKAIKNSSGIIAPALKYPFSSGGGSDSSRLKDVDVGAFRDYDPQINFMPRIAFSFPISDEAVFTAHYDVLTQRPAGNNRLDILRYQFIRSINSSAGNPISNPALKPEKTIDYEIGFQQVISKSSSLKVQVFYREMRSQIQVFQNVGAYPQDYYSVENLDFGTVKGMTLSYDLRKTGNITFRANYTLQFADGTGSGVGNAVNLNATDFSTLRTIAPLSFDQRHKFNVAFDYRYDVGSAYNGPKLGNFNALEGTGANFTVDLGSGTPYSASSDPTQSRLLGSINGSRLPWRFTTNFQLDRDIPVTFSKKGDEKKMGNINVYVLVNNLFNTKNVQGVNPYSGNPSDDGYLADARYQSVIDQKVDAAAYRDLYTLNQLRGGNFSQPRVVRLGVRLDF